MTGARRAVIVGISGCSSSGKTTLSRLLRDIFPNTFVLHEDDFYRPESELPTKNGLLDWDCVESLDLPAMAKSMEHIHNEGTFPPELDSKEDMNSIGECPVPDSTIESLKATVRAWSEPGRPGHGLLDSLRLCVIDGFLLYSQPMAFVQPYIDIKLFLRVSHAKAKARREARSGYVTIEGFWEDPPGYMDKIVWPNYLEAHRYLFRDGNVEGELQREATKELNIQCQEGLDVDMTTTLEWAVKLLMEHLPKVVSGGSHTSI